MFRELVIYYQDRVGRLVRRQVGDSPIAEDLSQEIFVRAYRALPRFSFQSSFATWLTRIALNHTHSYFLSRRYQEHQKTDSLERTGASGMQESPERLSEQRQMISAFREALAKLSQEHRDVLVLCSLEGKSYDEVASILSVPTGTVRSRLNKARLLMKVSLRSYLPCGDAS